MKRLLLSLACLTLLYAPARAQNNVTVDEKTEKLEALKQELESARQLRDKVIAKRWEDRQKDAEGREQFNQQFDEIKNQLELKTGAADRLQEEIQNGLREAEEAEADAENSRIQFATLSDLLRDRISELSEPLGRGFPAHIAERQQAVNHLLKTAEVSKDAPAEIVNALLTWFRQELKLSRAIVQEERAFVMADGTPGQGTVLRIGMVASAFKDTQTGRVGLMLRSNAQGTSSPWIWVENLPEGDRKALSEAMVKLSSGSKDPVLVPTDVFAGQGQARTYTAEKKMGLWEQIVHMIKTGGVFMWPLLVIPIVVLVLFFQKLVYLNRRSGGKPKEIEAVLERIRQGDSEGALVLCDKHPMSVVLRSISTVVKAKSLGRDAAEKSIKEFLLHEVPRLERHLTTLSVMAASAPLLGLLGTVSGLIAMFQVITEHGVNDPKLLAGGII